MATRADQARAAVEQNNSVRKRGDASAAHPTRPEILRESAAHSAHGRAVHARTKLQADAKAGKPNVGKVRGFWQTGPHGGEEQTFNGVPGDGRGSDGPASIAKASRKSTRGAVPAGEKPCAQLTRQAIRETHTPEHRAESSIARGMHAIRGR